jgi:23S rRNA (guanosine2251-2'-O)-methyltransferase
VDRRRLRRRQWNRAALDDVIYGLHAVSEALAAGDGLLSLHVGKERRRDSGVRDIVAQASARNIPVRFEEPSYFSQFPYKAHQRVVAFGPPFEYAALEDIVHARRNGPLLLVVLDHITDPHNTGAILRTAEAAGAHGAVIPDRRSAAVNPTVRKAAAGASAHLPIARVTNVAQTLRSLKKKGVWVVGAHAGAEAGAMPYSRADWRRDVALVIGAEDTGISRVARSECDELVHIPMHGKVQSLNASVAAAILLYEAVRQRGSSAKGPLPD